MRNNPERYIAMNSKKPMDLSDSKGANPGDVFDIPTRSYLFSHPAMFPETLIEPLIKAGCPSEVCIECGKPKMPITKYTGKVYNSHDGSTVESDLPIIRRKITKILDSSSTSVFKTDVIKEKVVEWLPSCKCNLDFEPGVVLDIFAGSGTSGVVSQNLGRSSVLIEISKEYCSIIKERLNWGVNEEINYEAIE